MVKLPIFWKFLLNYVILNKQNKQNTYVYIFPCPIISDVLAVFTIQRYNIWLFSAFPCQS